MPQCLHFLLQGIWRGGVIEPCLLRPAPTRTGAIALDPNFISFILFKPVSH
jgi:hypothetical protein